VPSQCARLFRFSLEERRVGKGANGKPVDVVRRTFADGNPVDEILAQRRVVVRERPARRVRVIVRKVRDGLLGTGSHHSLLMNSLPQTRCEQVEKTV